MSYKEEFLYERMMNQEGEVFVRTPEGYKRFYYDTEVVEHENLIPVNNPYNYEVSKEYTANESIMDKWNN